jgi:hypothetical protein
VIRMSQRSTVCSSKMRTSSGLNTNKCFLKDFPTVRERPKLTVINNATTSCVQLAMCARTTSVGQCSDVSVSERVCRSVFCVFERIHEMAMHTHTAIVACFSACKCLLNLLHACVVGNCCAAACNQLQHHTLVQTNNHTQSRLT